MLAIAEADFSSDADAAAIVALLDEYANDPMGGSEPLSDHARTHLIGELSRRPTAHALLARVDGTPAGLAIFFEGFSTFACKPLLNLHDFMVSSRYRGQGVGKQLLARLEDIANGWGCSKLTLEVLEGNRVAQGLYRGAGYAGYELDPEQGKAMFWQKKLQTAAA